jgi:hypothetical protein
MVINIRHIIETRTLIDQKICTESKLKDKYIITVVQKFVSIKLYENYDNNYQKVHVQLYLLWHPPQQVRKKSA